jgi:hypothetical protein
MSDPWINRLVVSGPVDEVRRFQDCAATGKPQSATALSFKKLQALVHEDDRVGLDKPVDPWDDSNKSNPDGVGPPHAEARHHPGFMDLEYNFSLVRFEPDDLLVQVSRLFPRLCFVLGWVAPANDEAGSRFIQNGDVLERWLSDAERESLRDDAYRRLGLDPDYGSTAPPDDNEALWADWEGDWAQLQAVVECWADTVTAALKPPATGQSS